MPKYLITFDDGKMIEIPAQDEDDALFQAPNFSNSTVTQIHHKVYGEETHASETQTS